MKPKKNSMTTSASERRRKFNEWISVDMLRSEGSLPYFLSKPQDKETRVSNVMKNIDRKRLGLKLDKSQEHLPCDICDKIAYLHLTYANEKEIYKCEECLKHEEKT